MNRKGQSKAASASQEIDRKLAAMAPPRGKPSMGRHRVDTTKPREDKMSRQVTFSKRRSGLFKKAHELSIQCDAHLAIIMFSEVRNPFTFGSPSTDADAVLLPSGGDDGGGREALEEMFETTKVATRQLATEAKRVDDIGDRVTEVHAGKRCWWEADLEELGEAELVEFARSLGRLRANVSRRAEMLLCRPDGHRCSTSSRCHTYGDPRGIRARTEKLSLQLI